MSLKEAVDAVRAADVASNRLEALRGELKTLQDCIDKVRTEIDSEKQALDRAQARLKAAASSI